MSKSRFDQELEDYDALLRFLRESGRPDLAQDVRDLIGRMLTYRSSMKARNIRLAAANEEISRLRKLTDVEKI